MAIPIAESVLEAQQHLIQVLDTRLPGELSSAESSDYPLPAPEAFIEARPENWVEDWRNLNIDESAVWVHPFDPTQTTQAYSGDTTQYNYEQAATFAAAAILRERSGEDLPEIRQNLNNTPSRQIQWNEWMRRRGERYKGSIINALTKGATDGYHVDDLVISEHDAEVQDKDRMGRVVLAVVIVEFTQDVTVQAQ